MSAKVPPGPAETKVLLPVSRLKHWPLWLSVWLVVLLVLGCELAILLRMDRDTQPSEIDSGARVHESAAATNDYHIGDLVLFGRYPQSQPNQAEPISWVVLQYQDKQLLLLAQCCLSARAYHHENVLVTWEECDLRKWLNQDFLEQAFSSEEQACLVAKDLTNDDPLSPFSFEPDTTDRVFCLTHGEAGKYLGNSLRRYAPVTEMAKQQGAYFYSRNNSGFWWCRAPGRPTYNLAEMFRPDYVYGSDFFVAWPACGVRPAILVKTTEAGSTRSKSKVVNSPG